MRYFIMLHEIQFQLSQCIYVSFAFCYCHKTRSTLSTNWSGEVMRTPTGESEQQIGTNSVIQTTLSRTIGICNAICALPIDEFSKGNTLYYITANITMLSVNIFVVAVFQMTTIEVQFKVKEMCQYGNVIWSANLSLFVC